jgi:hypothetical protein
MLILAEFLYKFKFYCKGKSYSQYAVSFTNIKPNLLLIVYLTRFPLFSYKVQNYNDYCEVVLKEES